MKRERERDHRFGEMCMPRPCRVFNAKQGLERDGRIYWVVHVPTTTRMVRVQARWLRLPRLNEDQIPAAGSPTSRNKRFTGADAPLIDVKAPGIDRALQPALVTSKIAAVG